MTINAVVTELWPPLLPAGLHDHTLESLEALCVQSFGGEYRSKLFQRFRLLLKEIADSGLKCECWVDGSFLTTKPEPGDVDMVVMIPVSEIQALTEPQRVVIDRIFDHNTAKDRYGCDLYWEVEPNFHRKAYWRGLWGFLKDEVTPKGFAVLRLNHDA